MAEERLGIATAEQSRERAMPSIEQNTSPEPRAMQRSPEGEWSWHPEHVKVGEVMLGPTYRFMKLDTFIESDGVRIFVDCASGARLCKHGELGTSAAFVGCLAANLSTIRTMVPSLASLDPAQSSLPSIVALRSAHSSLVAAHTRPPRHPDYTPTGTPARPAQLRRVRQRPAPLPPRRPSHRRRPPVPRRHRQGQQGHVHPHTAHPLHHPPSRPLVRALHRDLGADGSQR